jgi:hypothetical protein
VVGNQFKEDCQSSNELDWKSRAWVKPVEMQSLYLPPIYMNQSYFDTDYKQTNRDKTMYPKRVSGWCDGCDKTFISDGQKCPLCGHKQGNRRRLKK